MGTVVRTWSMVHSEFYRRRYGRPAQERIGAVRGASQIRIVASQMADSRETGAEVKPISPGGARAAR